MKITTAKGKDFTIAWQGISSIDAVWYFGIAGSTVNQIVSVFTDPEETAEIIIDKDEEMDLPELKETMKGYTRFITIRVDAADGTINVGLGREYAEVS